MRALLDTNILIDYLNGIVDARDEIARYERPLISLIIWMEVMVGAYPDEDAEIKRFLRRFVLVDIDHAVAERAVSLRRARRIKLPDAIVWASAIHQGALLVTRNSKDFPPEDPGVRVPYLVEPIQR
jgi:predicted nucleic acid-binding protein